MQGGIKYPLCSLAQDMRHQILYHAKHQIVKHFFCFYVRKNTRLFYFCVLKYEAVKEKRVYMIKKISTQALLPFLIIILGAVLLECTVFNLRFWTTVGLPSPHPISISFPEDEDDNAHIVRNIGVPVRTVQLAPSFAHNIRSTRAYIEFHDENSVTTRHVYLINGYAPSHHILIGAYGNVRRITVTIPNEHTSLEGIELNRPLPFRFQWPRALMLAALASILYAFKKYKLGRYFASEKAWQRQALELAIVVLFAGATLFVTAMTVNFGWIPGSDEHRGRFPVSSEHPVTQVNGMVDSVLAGRLHLAAQPHESLLRASEPFSPHYRYANNVIALNDHVFFPGSGRYYSYFGITQVLTVHVPYRLVTGRYITPSASAMLFMVAAIFGIYFLWKELARRFLPNLPYSLFLPSLVMALFGSNLMIQILTIGQYQLAASSALAFASWGVFFMLRSTRDETKPSSMFICFGAVCLALAVGCRPTALIHSLMVPVVLWPVFRPRQLLLAREDRPARKRLLRQFCALAIPYAVIGLALMWYNWARFGSIFEFGINYHMAPENVGVATEIGTLNLLRRSYDGLFTFLFGRFWIGPHFPFVGATITSSYFFGHLARSPGIGVFALPVSWFLGTAWFMRRKENAKKAMPLMVAMITIGLIIAVGAALASGVLGSYNIDFLWLFVLASLLCLGMLYENAKAYGQAVATAVKRAGICAIGLSCLVLFGWAFNEGVLFFANPAVLRYIQDIFMII